jgi:uncharacterized protein YegP (UPF0339 family)
MKTKTKDGIEIYQGKSGQWFWRFRVKGRIKLDGSEGYASERNVRRAIRGTGWQLVLAPVRKVENYV